VVLGGFLLTANSCPAQTYTISTIAGNPNNIGDGGPATAALLLAPRAIALDSRGNLFVTDQSSSRVRRVAPDGVITTVAGSGPPGTKGDGGPATEALLNKPAGIAVDDGGNLYIADTNNHRIRKVTTDGRITTICGTGTATFGGDGGAASRAGLNGPTGVALDAGGTLYIADSGNERIRRVTPAGTISTVAGNGVAGFAGDRGPATAAQLNNPVSVAVDASGNLYIADRSNNRVRRVTPAGAIESIAGTGVAGYSGDNLSATMAQLNAPAGVALDAAGNLYVSENWRLRRITPAGIILSVAGGSTFGFGGDGGPAISAQLDAPQGIAFDQVGNLYLADQANHRVRRITPAGIINTVAGGGDLGDGGPATAARFYYPRALAADQAGNVYLVDNNGRRVRRFTPEGQMWTVAGDGIGGNSGDGGPATTARFQNPFAIAIDSAGNLHIADAGGQRIRKIWRNGLMSTIAGTGSAGFGGDGGPATAAQFNTPGGLAFDGAGNLYISDTGNSRVRRMTPAGVIATVAGDGNKGYGGDGGPGTLAHLNEPVRLAFDATGNLYIADRADQRIRRLTPAGIISTVAGNGTAGGGGDGGPATAAQLSYPSGVGFDSNGNMLLAVLNNHRIRAVSPSGVITTIAGSGAAGFAGDGGPALNAQLWSPNDVLIDSSGNILIADGDNRVVRKLTPLTCTYAISPASGVPVPSAGANALRVNVTAPLGCAWTAASNASWITITSAASGNGDGTISYSVAANTSSAVRTGTLTIAGQTFTVTQAAAPVLTAAGITNAASYAAGVTPGSIVTIFGVGLTKSVKGVIPAGSLPLPTQLAGTSVQVGGVAAPLFAVANVNGAEQINLQIPYEAAGQGVVSIVVNNNGETSAPIQVTVLPAHPGIFTVDGKAGAILHGADNALVTASNPAIGGEVVVIYATGLGGVNPTPRTGAAAPSSEPLARTSVAPLATVGGINAEVLFSGLAPGFVGLYQVNIRVPLDTPIGIVPIVLNAGGLNSNGVIIAVSGP
jgi:uncharacterized protein (TIGR03437 family)